MSWFTYYRTAESKDGLRPSVRRSIDRFVPLDNISEGQWLSVDVSGFGINQALDSTLQTFTSNYSYKVVYHDENVDGNYVVVDSVVDGDGRIYFKAAENHAVGEQISKRYYIYYRDNNLAQIVYDSQSQKYTLLGSPLAQTYILDEYEVPNNFSGHYSFSFLNSDLDWSNGYSEKIGATATLLFSGPNITLYGNTGPDYGAIKITITPIVNESNIEYEQRIEQFVDLYSQSEVKNVPLYSNANLNYRDYLIKIEVLRKQNVKSTSSKVYISKASFLFPIKAKVSDEELYEAASFNFLKVSNSKRFTLQNLKPGKNYILTVKAKNSDINVGSNYFKTVMFSVPDDNTVPAVPENLTLYASFLSVMFNFDFVSDLDISKYEYELYKENQITEIGPDEYEISGSQTPYLSGFNPSNIFTVAVDENTTSDGTDETPIPYYGRIRSIDTTGNISEWSNIVKSGDTPLIDEQFIGSLTAAKISAGTIGAHKITLGGANSIIQSSTYTSTSGQNGWYIGGDGHFSLGGPDGITYDNQTITIGSDVQVQANLAADSISVGSGTNAILSINDSINNGGGGMTLGDPTYNYWYANGRFRAGNADKYILWDGNAFTIRGDLRFSDNSIPGTFDNGDSLTAGSIGGVTIGSTKIYTGTGTYNNTNTGFYLDNAGNFSLKDKLSWNGTTLSVNGTVTATAGSIGGVTIASSKIYTGTGTYNNTNTGFYLDSSGNFSLKNKLSWNGTTLSVNGTVTASAGSIGGVTIASTKIYTGTGTYGNTNTGFYLDNAGNFSLKNKLTWNGTTLTVTGNISLNTNNYWNSTGTFKVGNATKYMKWDGTNLEITGKILGGTSMEGSISSSATITGGTIRTASSGERIEMSGTVLNLYAPNSSSNTATIQFNPPTNLYYGRIQSSGSLRIGVIGTADQVQIGYYSGGNLYGTSWNFGNYGEHNFTGRITGYSEGYGTSWSEQQIKSHNGTGSAGIAIRAGTDTGTVQLRVGYNFSTLYIRNYNDSANAPVQAGNINVQQITSSTTYNNNNGTSGRYVFMNTSGVFGYYSSSIKTKKNIKPIHYGLSDVMAINPVSFEYIKNEGERHIGMIEEELRKIVPEVCVYDEDDPDFISSINYPHLTSVLIKAIQDLKNEVDELRSQISNSPN